MIFYFLEHLALPRQEIHRSKPEIFYAFAEVIGVTAFQQRYKESTRKFQKIRKSQKMRDGK